MHFVTEMNESVMCHQAGMSVCLYLSHSKILEKTTTEGKNKHITESWHNNLCNSFVKYIKRIQYDTECKIPK